jgi:2-oxoisovalerate dehydrogenase E1 component
VDAELDPLEEHLLEELRALPARPGGGDPEAEAIWDAQVDSRACDFAARYLQQRGRGFYSIASAGHESNAAIARALLPTDPALVHYRSGAFYLARSTQVGRDGVPDILQGITAATAEPIAGGRHKVFGNHELNVIPLTSTIASHVPRGVGLAFAIERAAKLGVPSAWDEGAIAMCGFGDASLNHATAQAGLNSAAHLAYQGLPLPLLFVCEDNGLGISVATPAGWVETALRSRPQLRYELASGNDPEAALETCCDLVDSIRERRRPAVLHLRTVRYLSHAGADMESAYRTPQQIRADWDHDPLLATGAWLVRTGARTGPELADEYLERRARVFAQADEAAELQQLETAEAVMVPLARPRRSPVRASATGEALTVAQAINSALAAELERDPAMLVFGEDIAAKGGVYGVTRGLHRRFGAGRVFDTLLDETSILGIALGTALSGFTPVPEIQYLAYLHNAEDQLRGEAATMQFFSQGRYRNGMVVRVAGYGYQKGFGGHFHNDNAVGVLRDIPGLVIASPGRPDDAAGTLQTCLETARADGTVCVFLEPIALYHTRDLYDDGDGLWLADLGATTAPLGEARCYGDGTDLTIVTWANGLHLTLRAARRLAAEGLNARVLDLRWLAPLPVDDLLREAAATGRVLVVDETRRTGGVSEGVIAALVDAGFDGTIARVASKDSFIPLGDAARLVLVSEAEIEAAARRCVGLPAGTAGLDARLP